MGETLSAHQTLTCSSVFSIPHVPDSASRIKCEWQTIHSWHSHALSSPPGDLWGAVLQVVQDSGTAWPTADYSWVRNQTFVVLSHWVFRRLSTLTSRVNFSDEYSQKYNKKTNTRKQKEHLKPIFNSTVDGKHEVHFLNCEKKAAGYFAGSKVKWKQFWRFLLPQ